MISSSVIKFLLILGSTPLGGGGWVDGGGAGYGCVGDVPCTHTCTYMHMHACTHMHVEHDKHAKHGCLHVGGHLHFLYSYTCMYMHVHACTCVWGHPPCPQTPSTHLPPPQSHRKPKTPKFNKSRTNRDNSILFEDSLPLNTPELI